MSKPLITILPSASIWDAITLMGRQGIRRLPVVKDSKLLGILTERDVLNFIVSQQGLLLEAAAESLPPATREQLKAMRLQFGTGLPSKR